MSQPQSSAARVDVLVVDDNEAIRQTVAELMKSSGYSVEEASNGAEALSIVNNKNVGAILLDLRMPGTSGLAVLETIEDPPPIIITSAYALDHSDQERVDDKIFVHLVKPFHPRKLIDAVASAIGAPTNAPPTG